MEISDKLFNELQNRLKVGNRRGVHLNAIPEKSRYKFEISELSAISEDRSINFLNVHSSGITLRFQISWKDNLPDSNTVFEEEQANLVQITKSFENLINQTEAIESEKRINTFGFGYPLLNRCDQSEYKLKVTSTLIWNLTIKPSKKFDSWTIPSETDAPNYNKTIARKEAADLIQKMGADIDTSIAKRTNFVITGSAPGPSKMKKIEQLKAQGCDIRLAYEEEFLKMCNGL